MKVYYTDRFEIELPVGHRFPMQKYRLVREGLLREGVLVEHELAEPSLATRDVLLLAHTDRYVDAVLNGTLTPAEVRRIGFPWSEALVRRSLASVGGCLSAAWQALLEGASGCLAGGTHHAFADAGEGYCVFNDIAVATLQLLQAATVKRVAIIDLDVHQGNGNSSILGGRQEVFIFSMHAEKNYPFRKVPSTLDISLPDNTEDEHYLELLAEALPRVFAFGPDIVFYQAGVDILKEDLLGRLSISLNAVAERDRMVFSACYEHGVPVAVTLGGGYCNPIAPTIAAHVGTYRMLKHVWKL
ncbi:MAG: histone deacetylase [Acidobacteriota bacterium]|nr:histone deacetylase [Blastocatellia bacterium]MDW8411195.1 histone deacetylase [Acidobacteriota bacterium]